VAKAPEAFCHPRSSMAGTLLEDLAAGKSFAQVKAAFDKKTAPDVYQRPTAAPTDGAVKAAEDLVEKLGLAPALPRRMATLDEVIQHALWAPQAEPEQAQGKGVFASVKTKTQASPVTRMALPMQTMSWLTFARDVLPGASLVELYAQGTGGMGSVTAPVNMAAPPILMWDGEEMRNPYAWYVKNESSSLHSLGLSTGWTKVSAVLSSPTKWGRPSNKKDFDDQVVVCLDGANDGNGVTNCLFPETLRGDLHGIRSVIEAYNKANKLGMPSDPVACGFIFQKVSPRTTMRLRVTTATTLREVIVDRWE
jgi:hypothetical protein